MQIDDTDRRILACLDADSRRTFDSLGQQVGLSAPAVKRRVDRLVASGVIERFSVVVSREALGRPLEAFVELYCDGQVAPARIKAMLSDVEEVRAAYTVTGDADALIHVFADSVQHFEGTLERIRNHRGVKQTRSTIVLSRL